MKNDDGIWYLSSSARMRGNPSCAPKSAAESVVGEVWPAASKYDSLSTSKLRQTATRAPLGHVLGVNFLPARTGATAFRSCSSVHFVPGCCAIAGRGAETRATAIQAEPIVSFGVIMNDPRGGG